MHYILIRICTVERGEKVGVIFLHILPPVLLLMPDRAACLDQHVRYVQPAQITKVAATLTAKDQATSITCIEGEDLPIHIFTKFVFSTLDFFCSYGV